ncbi:MAG: caspase family protein [Gammaproteobacteria bacterium]|nr:caspase family protein [Gammaproteobacteria bacterium]
MAFLSAVKYYFIVLLSLFLTACQPSPSYLSKGSGTGLAVQTPESVKIRACWQAVPPRSAAAPATFILAAGANVGKLTMTDEDAWRFAKAMQKHFHVPNAYRCVLENVYRAEFEKALADLAGAAKANDRVIIYFSGHGARVKDDDGDEAHDEYKRDEVFVTMDTRNMAELKRAGVVPDDRFVALVNVLSTNRVITVIDACFSGGMYKNSGDDVLLAHARIKFYPSGDMDARPGPQTQAAA